MMASMASLHSLTPEYVANEDKLNDEFDFGVPAPVMNAGGGLHRYPSALTMHGTMNGTQHPPSLDNDNPMSKFMAITGTIKVPKTFGQQHRSISDLSRGGTREQRPSMVR